MTEYERFNGRVEPMVLGKATYTVLPLPSAVATALVGARRVEGEPPTCSKRIATLKAELGT